MSIPLPPLYFSIAAALSAFYDDVESRILLAGVLRMTPRLLEADLDPTPTRVFDDIILRSPPNWTAGIFFAILSFLHFSIALPAFYHGRVEGYMSLILGTCFAAISLLSVKARTEIAVLPAERRLRLRSGIGRFRVERSISFQEVHGIRLTLAPNPASTPTRLEVLCDNEDIDCPPAQHSRQDALTLAIMMRVQLIKVFSTLDDNDDPPPPRADLPAPTNNLSPRQL